MPRPHRSTRERQQVADRDPPAVDFESLKRDCEVSAAIGGFFGQALATLMRAPRTPSWFHLGTRDEDIR